MVNSITSVVYVGGSDTETECMHLKHIGHGDCRSNLIEMLSCQSLFVIDMT